MVTKGKPDRGLGDEVTEADYLLQNIRQCHMCDGIIQSIGLGHFDHKTAVHCSLTAAIL